MHEPGKVAIAGDWHGNERWALAVIDAAAEALKGEDRKILLQAGDFGIWPGQHGRWFLSQVSAALAGNHMELWFVDGNHEDFDQLDKLDAVAPPGELVPVVDRIFHLRRGHRWCWHERTWVALGGAVSVDRAFHHPENRRVKGVSWWPQEEITQDQAAAVIAAGPADVLLSHDCPSGVRHTFPEPPPWWNPADIQLSDEHGERLQTIVDTIQPISIIHGHLHRGYSRICDFGYGPVTVTGLDCDADPVGLKRRPAYSQAVLDVRSMRWEYLPL